MNTLKKIALAAMIAASLGAVSTTAFAESDPGRISYPAAQAVDMLAGKFQTAIDSVTSGADAETTGKAIKEASDFSKEVNANDRVARAVAKAINVVKAARKDIQDGNSQQAEAKLRDAHKQILEAKNLI
jgi:hypothetical protein